MCFQTIVRWFASLHFESSFTSDSLMYCTSMEDFFIRWEIKKITSWRPLVRKDTHLCHSHLLKSHFLQSFPHSLGQQQVLHVCKFTEDTGQILLPPGLDLRQRQFLLTEAMCRTEVGHFRNVSSLLALLYGFKGKAASRGTSCSKVVPLLPELLLTFMNRAFTQVLPAGCRLCVLCKSVISHAATGDVNGGWSFPLVAVERIRPSSLVLQSYCLAPVKQSLNPAAAAAAVSRFALFLCLVNVGTVAAIHASWCRGELY